MNAIKIIERVPLPNHTIMIGPRAIFGRLFSTIRYGSAIFLTYSDHHIASATAVPARVARTNPDIVSYRVVDTCFKRLPSDIRPETVFTILEGLLDRKLSITPVSASSSHKAKIIINGDASGDNRSTTSEYTNYIQIKNRLASFGYKNVEFRLKPFNPPIKSRIAAWNNKILSNSGEREIIISPKCKWLIYNCENLKYKEGTIRIDVPAIKQIKQDKNLKYLTHPFDAASYLVDFYFPLKNEF